MSKTPKMTDELLKKFGIDPATYKPWGYADAGREHRHVKPSKQAGRTVANRKTLQKHNVRGFGEAD